jgi:hypothetical protein
MKTLFTTIVFLFLTSIIVSCGSTQDATKNKLVDQNNSLEKENAALKKENLELKAEINVLRQSLPKPVEKVDPNGGIASQVSANATSMYLEEDLHHFGEVKGGEKLQHVFKFKNTGNYPLTIKAVKTSCGCTVTKWNKSPIAIGETGEIGVLFDTTDKSGEQRQTITVQANTSPVNTQLTILATVR